MSPSEVRLFQTMQHSLESLSALPGPALVALWNSLNPTNPVRKFSDKRTAVRRVWELGRVAEAKTPPSQEKTPAPEKAEKGAKSRKRVPRVQPAKPHVRRKRFCFAPREEIRPMRPGTARFKAMELLARPQGAKFSEVMKVTGWDEKKAYEGVRILNNPIGYGLAYADLPDGDFHIWLVKTMKEFTAKKTELRRQSEGSSNAA